MANDEVDRKIWESIQQRLEPSDRDKVKLDSVKTVLASLVDEHSPHYYVEYVTPHLPDEALKFRSLSVDRAKEILPHLHATGDNLLPENLGKSFSEYMVCTKEANKHKRAVMLHSEIMQELKNQVLKTPRSTPEILDNEIGTLLGLTFWLYMFFCKKEARGHRDYKKYYRSLHNFLTDLILTLVELRCLLGVPSTISSFRLNGKKIPTFHKIIPHICISPEHPAFQRHILKKMLGIINVIDQSDETLEALASKFCSEFKRFTKSSVRLKVPETVLKIVKDQSRYLAFSSPELRKNFVAYKTKTCASMILELQHAASGVRDIFDDKKRGSLSDEKCLEWVHEIHKCMCSPGDVNFSHFPPLPTDGDRSSEQQPMIKTLNCFHHELLYNLSVFVLREKVPNVDKENRFVLNDRNFTNFVMELARTAISKRPPPEVLAPEVLDPDNLAPDDLAPDDHGPDDLAPDDLAACSC